MTRLPDQLLRVRVRHPGAVPDRGRRLRTALGHARLHPASLPPSAVLVVRRLGDALGVEPVGPGRPLSAAWQRAARRAVEGAARSAARPQHGRVPEAARAVIFADPAEHWACAAVAEARGRRPWWAESAPAQTLRRLVAEARLAPAVLDHVARWGHAQRVLAGLAPDHARDLLDAVAEAFGVPAHATPPAVETPSASDAPPAASTPEAESSGRADVAAPWDALGLADVVGEVERGAGREHAALLGMAVVLARAPHRLRTPEARATLRAWRERPPEPTRAPTDPPPSRRTVQAPLSQAVGARAGGVRPKEKRAAKAPPSSSAPPLGVEVPPYEPPSPEVVTPAPDLAEPAPDGTATDLGGVLFLLPVMRALDLPDAFEAGWRLASAVGGWGVLEALSRSLLGDAHGTWADDPAWHVLAGLDGRPSGEPPRDALRPDPPRLPANWPRPVGPAPPGLSVLPATLATWAHLALPAVQSRLADALGLDDASEIAPALLVRRGTLHATTSHLDVVLPLSSARLDVRRAGLDVDPGWLPAFGRVVQFHYV